MRNREKKPEYKIYASTRPSSKFYRLSQSLDSHTHVSFNIADHVSVASELSLACWKGYRNWPQFECSRGTQESMLVTNMTHISIGF